MKNFIFFLTLLTFFYISFFAAGETGKDHGVLDERHVHVAKDFVDKNLKSEGAFTLFKINGFIEFLKKQRNEIKSDIYETELIERMELGIKKYKKSKKKSKEKATRKKSKILQGFDLFLIPKIEALSKAVFEKKDQNILEGIVDDFVRAYIPYFSPNAHRTIWPRDLDLKNNIKRSFKRYRFEKENDEIAPASNLRVERKHLKKIRNCLGFSKHEGEYLNPKDLDRLRKCGFDLSLLNPGVSSLWKGLQDEDLDTIRGEPKGTYPEETDTVYLKEVILRGHQSPKLKILFKRGEKEYSLKLKMGYEVHTDYAASKISEFAGFNQDSMRYYKRIKVYLGDTDVEQFKSQLANKYGVESIVSYITAFGKDELGDWILLHDVSLESRDYGEIRVAPIDLSSWDLGNRREYRGMLLFWAWLNIQNAKPANFKFLFKETENGLVPLHRFHDLGTSMGTPFSLRNLNYVLSILENENVDTFPDSFLEIDKKGRLKLFWNDMSQFARYFEYTTWDDLKWMARKILSIDEHDIYRSLRKSGISRPAAKLYYLKLMLKRNEMIECFSLEKEFKKEEIPKLKNYNLKDREGNDLIKEGKLIKKVYKDQNSLPVSVQKWATFLTKILNFDIPIYEWTQTKTKNTTGLSTNGLEGLKVSMGVKDPDLEPFALTTLPVGVGLEAVLSRSVSVNEQVLNDNEEFHTYKITDRVQLKFGLDSPLLSKLASETGFLGADASLKFYEYEFRFVHYNDSLKKAYLSSFDLPKIMRSPTKWAALNMNPIEAISTYQRVGFEVEGDLRVYSMSPGVKNQIALTFGAAKASRKYLLRDQYGQLHIYQDKLKESYAGFVFGLAELDLFFAELPFFKVEISTHHYQNEVTDYFLPLDSLDRRTAKKTLSLERRNEEYKALRAFKKRKKDDPLPDLMKLNYKVESKGKRFTVGVGALFLFNRSKTVQEARTKISLPSGKKNKFYRYSLLKSKSLGLDPIDLPLMDLLVSKRKKTSIILEANLKKKEDSVLVVRVQDYYRVRNKEKLENLILDLNRRYSEKSEKPFFRDFTLPDEETVDKYRKIYGITRIFLGNKNFGESLYKTTEKKIKFFLQKHFWDRQFTVLGKKVEKPGQRQRLRVKFRKYRALKALRKVREHYLDTFMKGEEKYLKLSAKALYKLCIEEYGIHFLNLLMRKKDFLVLGEITGVHPSYSTLQDLQSLQRRRFSAKHWGSFDKKLPIQKYLRYERVLPPLTLIEKGISDSLVLGELETSLAPNLEPLFGTNTEF